MVVQCCVCKRVHIGDEWIHVADPHNVARTASHGYCPVCMAEAYAKFQEQECVPVAVSSAA